MRIIRVRKACARGPSPNGKLPEALVFPREGRLERRGRRLGGDHYPPGSPPLNVDRRRRRVRHDLDLDFSRRFPAVLESQNSKVVLRFKRIYAESAEMRVRD